MEANGVRTVGRSRTEDALLQAGDVVARVHAEYVTPRTIEPRQHQDAVAGVDALEPSTNSSANTSSAAGAPHRPVSVRQRDRREASEPTRSDAHGSSRRTLHHLGCQSGREALSAPSGVFVTVVEIGDVGMGVHQHVVPMPVLMPSDSLLGMDVVVVIVIVNVFVVVVRRVVMMLVEVR